MSMRIRKGDTVMMRIGKDRGKKGRVLQVVQENRTIVVEGLNLNVKHVGPRQQRQKGQRIQFAKAVDVSNVALICPKCNKATRVGIQRGEGKKSQRVCKKCDQVIS